MKLKKEEQATCDQFGKRDKHGKVHCSDCPLVIDRDGFICAANIDGRTKAYKEWWKKRETD